jgi:hypothetical protein
MGAEFTANGSLRDACPTCDDTGKVLVDVHPLASRHPPGLGGSEHLA